MKKIILFAFIVLISGFSKTQAQEKKTKVSLLPDTVIAAYKAKYKKIEVDQWFEDDGNYKAAFKKGPIKYKATFNVDGRWLSTATEVDKDKISGAIKKQLKSPDYKGWKIERCEKVETPAVPKTYILKLKKSKELQILSFDATGKLIQPDTK